MKALIVGGGSAGRRHAATLRDVEPDCRITILRSHGAVGELQTCADSIVSDLADALHTPPDVAVIANASAHHISVAMELAAHDVHLLIEKPMSNRSDHVGDLISMCRRSGLTLMVGYNLRFFTPLAELRDRVRSGAVGRLLSVRAEVGQYLPDWRPGLDYRASVSARSALGGGAILELSHELDYVRWIAGEVVSVRAWASRVSDLDVDVEDSADVIMTFASGSVANVHLDYFDRTPVRRCRVAASHGTLELDLLTGSLREFLAATRRWSELIEPRRYALAETYDLQIRHFLDCVRSGRQPVIDGEEGLRTLRLAEAVKAAATSGAATAP